MVLYEYSSFFLLSVLYKIHRGYLQVLTHIADCMCRSYKCCF